MTLYYAERLGGPGEPYIAERGIFLSIEEFAPYRAKGWEGTKETNAAADAFLQEQAIREIAQEAHSMGRLYSESDERELPAVEFQRVAAMVTRKLEEAKR